MAIMAGEAITEGGQAGMARASARRQAGRRGEQMRSRRVTRRTPIEGEMGGTQTETTSYGPARGGDRGGSYAQGYGRQARYVGQNAQLAPGRSTYQGAILAEFLTAIIIISVAPLATGGSPGHTGISPYAAKDLKRLLAIGMTYFLLALIPGQNGSRIGAWLGFLVLLVLLMGALNAGELSAVLGIFSEGGTQPPGATQGTGP